MSTNLDLTIGALEIGVMISAFLFGAVTLQVWSYYQTFPEDTKIIKFMVGSIWLLRFAHTLCGVLGIYTLTITDYGHPDTIFSMPTSLQMLNWETGLIVMIVQGFYAYRVRALTGKPYMSMICWAGSGTMFILTCITIINTIAAAGHANVARVQLIVMDISMGLCTSVDILIAISLSWYFKSQRSGALGRTARLMDQLRDWTIVTAFLTSLSAITTVITYGTMGGNLIWFAAFMLGGSMHANFILALLNARVKFRQAVGGAVIDFDSETSRGSKPVTTIALGNRTSVKVCTTSNTSYDPSVIKSYDQSMTKVSDMT